LAEAAWGGQILLSDVTWDLARERMPIEFGSIDLGRHQLTGFADSMRLHQLIHPDLLGDFPRPRAMREAMTNLPAQLTTFVGRDRELAEIHTLKQRARLVTLTGPGGAGKTRLAQEAAGQLIDEFHDGVWFVDLAPLTSPDRVSAAFARPLGVSGQPGRETEAVLIDYCSSRQLLLVIDNCEHLIEKTAVLVSELLQSAPGLAVLATSREALGVPGEAIYEIGPLSVPAETDGEAALDFESVRLFLDRAPHLGRLEPAELEAVGRICRRLDGMPLALELAAARARMFSPRQLADLLDDRFAVLATPERGRPPRHQTLHAIVAWSYGLLSEPARVLFRRMSVFRGGFDVAALRDVCGSIPLNPAATPGLLAELIEKSLVLAHPRTGRYRLLETLREFGQQMLTPNEAQDVRTRHAHHYSSLAEDAASNLRGPGQAASMAVFTNDLDNFRKALRWSFGEMPAIGIQLATSLADYWDAAGPRGEAHEWLRRAVDLSDQVAPALRINARLAASDLFVSSDLSHSVRYATEALDEARAIGDELAEARSLRALGWARGLQEEPEEAIRLCAEALAIFERSAETWESAWCLERMAQSDYRDPIRSLQTYQESLARFRSVGDERRSGLVLYKMAERNIQAGGDMALSESWVRESLEISERLGSTHDVAHAHGVLGWVLRMRGRFGQARGVLEVALDSLLKVGDERCAVRAMSALGHVLIDTGNPSAAGAMLRQSLEKGLQEKTYVRASIDGLGRLAEQQGRLEEAAMMYAAAHKLRERLRLPEGTATVTARSDRFARLRESLGEPAFHHAWAQGAGLTPDEVVALAFMDP
jgi:predicted ATPase